MLFNVEAARMGRIATLRSLVLAGAILCVLLESISHLMLHRQLLFVEGAANSLFNPITATTNTNINNNNNATTPAAPYWRRPGCYQVGHTRTISIPGCVKFNLSTNACRGFCMSFSIPAAEDIGPASQAVVDADGQLVELLSLGGDAAAVLGLPGKTVSSSDAAAASSTSSTSHNNANQRKWSAGSPTQQISSINSADSAIVTELDELAHLGGTRSPLAGAIGNTNDKRDVVSVGQCCNMMETEDVTVNLRCGLNETRRLVFKSAKTCECFFCKHV